MLTNNCTIAYKTRWELGLPVSPLGGETTNKEATRKKPKYDNRVHANLSKGSIEHTEKEIKETVPLSPTEHLPQKATPQRKAVKTEQFET